MKTLTKPTPKKAPCKLQVCATCARSKHERENDGTIRLKCSRNNGNVNGFNTCERWGKDA